MELIKRPYELSIWEFTPGEEKTSETQLAIIGTNTMSSPMRAMEPIFIKNVNGTFTLEFKLYTRYFDTEKGEFAENPYINLLMAERFLKLKYKDKWYDLIIKSRQESSDSKTYTYTATSMHINELSKSGFNLEFKTELENNQGTILELGNKIMEGTDWTIDEEGSDIIRATQKEQLVICTYSDGVNVTPILGGNEEKTLSGNFYVFYSDYAKVMSLEEGSAEIQILYINHGDASDLDEYINEGNYSDEEGILTIGENCLFTATKSNLTKVKLSQFTGRRIVKQQKTRYNSALDKYVSIYNDGKVEGFVETEYLTSQIVQNLITNSKDFQSTSGWYYSPGEDSDDPAPIIEVDYYPPLLDFIKIEDDSSKVEENTEITSRLKLTGKAPSQKFYNTGLRSHLSYIDSIKEGESYILQVNLVNENNESVGKFSKDNANIGTTVRFCFKYQREITEGSEEENGFFDKADGTGKDDEWGISSENSNWEYINNEYNQIELIFPKAISKEDLKKFRFEIQIDNKDTPVFIKEIQLFKKIEKADGSFVIPGEVPESKVIENKFFYNVEENKDNTSREKYQWLSNNENYEPFYDKDYNKIASIEKSESNRFNLIQDLCEKFECWANFNITHNDDGTIDKKTIQFKEYAGDVKYAGFTYGINLASIKRTINSSQIVTKTIVQQNTNEHGTDSFCSISRAKENPTGQNFILNFDYYINQGLLNKDTTYADLEDYYSTAKPITQEQQTLINSQQAVSASLLQTKALLESSTQIRDNAEQEIAQLETEYFQYTKLIYPNINPDCIVTEKIENEDGTVTEKTEIVDSKVREYIVKIQNLEKILKSSKEEVEKYSGEISVLEETYESNKEELEAKNNELTKVNDAFFKKYGNYIFEGTWSSEDYWDDSLYYLDALDVSRTSSKPQVTYTINVIDISMQEGYEPYDIDVGDKSFIEDVEFFGYIYWFDGERTLKKPYREEIVVTELKEYLDSPEKNEIKVQNYKTQFEDLFQRITASTQQLQYARGGYNRASAAFNNDGTIDGSILQNTLLSYAFTLLNPENDSVVWDEDGIKIIDRKNVDRILKLSGGELAITNDGGATWSTAIDGNGIHLNLVTSGTINTDKIMIGNSENYAFRWDRTGLNAYTEKADGGGYDYGKFVRFDQYGLYGYSGGTIFDPLSLDEVKQSADFGLTWDGFFLKSKHDDPNDNGYIEIDSKDDFQVYGSDGKPRIKIGLIEVKKETTTNEAGETVTETVITDRIYGLRLYDKDGNSVVDTDSNGNISITGTIKATSGNIGNWQIVNGNITSAQTETEYGTQGIVLDATNSQIYSAQYKTSLGMDGWSINNDEAIFNNITLRGALKCAVLEYGEVQAVGGILMIRPSTAIKDYKFVIVNQQKEEEKDAYYTRSFNDGNVDYTKVTLSNDGKYLQLEVENPFYFRNDDWIKITSEADGDIVQKDEEGRDILYTGINTNLFKCAGVYYVDREEPVLDNNGDPTYDEEGNLITETIKKPVVLLDLTTGENYDKDGLDGTITKLNGLHLKGMGLVDLGQPTRTEAGAVVDGSIGISLNSSENHAMVPETSFSMFTLEERNKTTGNGTWKYIKPHIILGKIPDEEIYKDIRGKYGLYADAAYITGHIRARSLVVGFNDEEEDSGKDLIGDDGYINPDAIGGLQEHLDSLQNQIDGVVDTWYYKGEPGLDKPPVTEWSDEEKDRHLGDLYYDTDTGFSYRFAYTEEENDNGEKVKVYCWIKLEDNEITAALQQIAETNAALDSKVSTFMAANVDAGKSYLDKAQEGDLLFTDDGKIYIAVKEGEGEEKKLAWREQVSSAQPTENTEYYYAYSTDGIQIPGSDSWIPFNPETTTITPSPGSYLWIKTVTVYSNGARVPSYSVSYQGEDGEAQQGKYVVTITTQYITVGSTDGTPTESDMRWTNDVPNSYDPNNKYYFRYKYTWSDGDTTYSVAEEWSNPHEAKYWFDRGSVLEFDQYGNVVRNLKVGLTYVECDEHGNTNAQTKNYVKITFNNDSSNSWIASRNGLVAGSNAVFSGTVVASQGLLGGWLIGSRTVDKKPVYYLKNTNDSIWLDSAGKSAEINGTTANMVLKVGSNFGVSNNGTLYASNAKIKGEITATSLTVVRSEQKEETLDEILNSLQTEVQGISITGEQVFKKVNSGVSPASITLNTQMVGNLTINKWEYKRGDGSWTNLNTTNSSFTINSSGTNPNFNTFFNNNNNITSFRVTAKDNNNNSYSDTFSVYIVSDGSAGKGIASVTNYYWANNKSTGVAVNTTGADWQTTMQSVNATNKYLWNYEKITYSDNSTPTTTTPSIISTYVQDGKNGKEIRSITEYYAINNSGTTAPADNTSSKTNWYTTLQVPTEQNRYLWNYEVINYSEGNPETTGKRVIGVYGDPAYTILLSNENFSFTADKNGNIVANSNGSNQSTTCTVSALKGTSSANVQITNWSSSNSNVSITSPTTFPTGNQSSITLTIQAAKNTNIGENGKITLTIKVDGKEFKKELTYSVTKQGVDGNPAIRYYLTASNQFIRKNASGALSPSKITFYSKKQTGTSESDYSVYFQTAYSTDGNSFSNTNYTTASASKEITLSNTSAVAYRARAYSDNSRSTLLCELIIPVLEDGHDGETYYTYIRYSNSSNGSDFDANPSGKAYIGICTTTSASPPDNETSYTWSKFKGEDGKGISSTTIDYAASTNGTSAPSTGWQPTVPSISAGQYLWTRTTINYSSGSPSYSYSVSKAGSDGKSVTNVTIEYCKTTNSAGPTTSDTWSPTVPNNYEKDMYYFYRYKYTYSDNNKTTSNAIPWDNPYKVSYYLDAGAVLRFDNDGNIIQTKEIDLDWGFITGSDLPDDFPTDKQSLPTVKENIVVRRKDDDNKENWYLISRNGLIVQSNAVIEGTVIATNGIFTGTVNANAGQFGNLAIRTKTGLDGQETMSIETTDDSRDSTFSIYADGLLTDDSNRKITHCGVFKRATSLIPDITKKTGDAFSLNSGWYYKYNDSLPSGNVNYIYTTDDIKGYFLGYKPNSIKVSTKQYNLLSYISGLDLTSTINCKVKIKRAGSSSSIYKIICRVKIQGVSDIIEFSSDEYAAISTITEQSFSVTVDQIKQHFPSGDVWDAVFGALDSLLTYFWFEIQPQNNHPFVIEEYRVSSTDQGNVVAGLGCQDGMGLVYGDQGFFSYLDSFYFRTSRNKNNEGIAWYPAYDVCTLGLNDKPWGNIYTNQITSGGSNLNIKGNVLPNATGTYTLGTSTSQWKSINTLCFRSANSGNNHYIIPNIQKDSNNKSTTTHNIGTSSEPWNNLYLSDLAVTKDCVVQNDFYAKNGLFGGGIQLQTTETTTVKDSSGTYEGYPNSFIELYGGSGESNYHLPMAYIDFHYGHDDDNSDYSSRIIENRYGGIDIIGRDATNINTTHTYISTQKTINNNSNCLHLQCPSGGSIVISNGTSGSSSNSGGSQTPSAWNNCLFRTSGSEAKAYCFGSWYLGTSTLITSDINLKHSIEGYNDKYSLLFDGLNPIRYKYNNGTSNRYHTGFIAQEVEQAILEAGLSSQDFAGFVRDYELEYNANTGKEVEIERCYLRYEEFIALNTNEIQKLKKRVAELEAQLARLTAAT